MKPSHPALLCCKAVESADEGKVTVTWALAQRAERALVYTRRMDITNRSLETAQQYEAIRSLFGEMEKSDAQSLLLAHH